MEFANITFMLTEHADGVVLPVRIKSRAGRTRIAGERAGRLLIETSAPPVDNQANEAVCRLLAKTLHVPLRCVTVAHGARAKDKLIRIEAATAAEIATALGMEHPTDGA